MRTSTSSAPTESRNAAADDRPRGEAGRLRRGRRHRARRHPARAGAAEAVRRRRLSRLDGLDRRDAGAARRPAHALAGGALDHRARHELRAGPRSARRARKARPRRDLRLCAEPRLSRRHQRAAEGNRRPHRREDRRRREGVRRHRAGHGKAARRGGRHRLAGQAHQSGQPRVRLVAVSRHASSRPPRSRRTWRRKTIAAPAAPASTPARPTPSRRPTGSMRGAASPTSPSRTRGRSRTNSARRSATASMAATTAWPPARGTSSPGRHPRRSSPRATICASRRLAELLALDDAAFRALFLGLAGQAHRPRPLSAQRADRRRQFRRPDSGCPLPRAARRCFAAGARRGGLGAVAASAAG